MFLIVYKSRKCYIIHTVVDEKNNGGNDSWVRYVSVIRTFVVDGLRSDMLIFGLSC